MGIGGFVFSLRGDVAEVGKAPLFSSGMPLKESEIKQLARSITVEIMSSEEHLGSGTMIAEDDHFYFIATNAHVLNSEETSYQVRTFDGKVHSAQVVTDLKFQGKDLALLKFPKNEITYSVVKLGTFSPLKIGDKVFASGFPFSVNNRNSVPKFSWKTGRISLLLEKPLKDGYAIGYTNEVEKGMSGGPLLNEMGELVAINGLHGNPLWEAQDLFEDGSEPCPPLQSLISRYSFGIPLETLVQLSANYVPSLKSDPHPPHLKTELSPSEKALISKLEKEAKAAQNCSSISQE